MVEEEEEDVASVGLHGGAPVALPVPEPMAVIVSFCVAEGGIEVSVTMGVTITSDAYLKRQLWMSGWWWFEAVVLSKTEYQWLKHLERLYVSRQLYTPDRSTLIRYSSLTSNPLADISRDTTAAAKISWAAHGISWTVADTSSACGPIRATGNLVSI